VRDARSAGDAVVSEQPRFRTVAILDSKPEYVAELRALLLALVEPSRKDEGCTTYVLHEVIGDPNKFLFYEGWSDIAALDAHVATPKLQHAQERFEKWLARPVTIYQMNVLA
jgi:quinol monooxygenase YgiN